MTDMYFLHYCKLGELMSEHRNQNNLFEHTVSPMKKNSFQFVAVLHVVLFKQILQHPNLPFCNCHGASTPWKNCLKHVENGTANREFFYLKKTVTSILEKWLPTKSHFSKRKKEKCHKLKKRLPTKSLKKNTSASVMQKGLPTKSLISKSARSVLEKGLPNKIPLPKEKKEKENCHKCVDEGTANQESFYYITVLSALKSELQTTLLAWSFIEVQLPRW